MAPATVLARCRQVHGASVVVVDDVPHPGSVPEGDVLLTNRTDVSVAVCSADCGAVALAGDGLHGAVHVGWRGLVAGTLETAVAHARRLEPSELYGALGPCIGPCCYEFSPADLDQVCGRVGEVARGSTGEGHPSLDLPGAIAAVLGGLGVALDASRWRCTVCGGGLFSFRRDHTAARQALVVWRDAG